MKRGSCLCIHRDMWLPAVALFARRSGGMDLTLRPPQTEELINHMLASRAHGRYFDLFDSLRSEPFQAKTLILREVAHHAQRDRALLPFIEAYYIKELIEEANTAHNPEHILRSGRLIVTR